MSAAFVGTALLIQLSLSCFDATAFLPAGSNFCFAFDMLVTLNSSAGKAAG
ncbi:hypothetical protein [Aureimonas psammosilenae]|uniref:hypothetical protein n=1 Tax=Aureimonas psammosilenae TaxID=2495496 RepID=UPI001869AC01|nr:hypothetical protein [Aureimonas psammosilenae]